MALTGTHSLSNSLTKVEGGVITTYSYDAANQLVVAPVVVLPKHCL